MADITKRVQKKMQSFLEPDETVVSAILVEPKGTYGIGMVGHAVANNTTTSILQDSASNNAQRAGGVASTFPSKPFILARTNKRILMAESNGIRFSEPSTVLKHGQVKVTERKRKLLGQRLTITCFDGSSMIVDAQLGQPVDSFM